MGKPVLSKQRCLSFSAVDYPFPQGYFDQAEQKGSCGAGAVLFVTPVVSYHLSTTASVGTNTRSELFALWILLWFAHSLFINSRWIFGDSKCIVDWAIKKTKLSSLLLMHWKSRVDLPL